MNHFTFQRRTRPLPMLLTGALLTPLALLAGCGSTPDEPPPAPVELAPAPAQEVATDADASTQPDSVELVAAEPAEIAPEEEEVDLQVAGMRAALEKAMRDSGIDPVTLDATEETVATEEPDEPADVGASETADLLAAEEQLDPQTAEDATEGEDELALAAPSVESSDEVDELVATTDGESEPAVPAADLVANDEALVEEAHAETALEEQAVAGNPDGEQTAIAGESQADSEVSLAQDGAPDEEPAEVAAEPTLSPAEEAMLEAELALLELDPSRVGPVAFEDFGAAPAEPDAPAEELVLTEDAADEAQLASVSPEGEDAELAVVVTEPETHVPAFAPVPEDGLPGFALQPADWPHEHTELVAALDAEAAEQALLAAESALALDEAPTEEAPAPEATGEGLAQTPEAAVDFPDAVPTDDAVAVIEPDAVEADAATEVMPGKSGAPADLAKYGAIQWQLVEHASTTLTQVDVPDVQAQPDAMDATGADALPIERVEVPAVAAALHPTEDWGTFEFLRSLPLEDRALLAPLVVLDPSGGLALMGTGVRGLGEVTGMALSGPPQDPALDGLSYSDGSEFDPAPIDSTAVVVDEPGIGMIWWSEEVPLAQIDATSEIQTPSVGRVRVVLHSGDYVEGSLHSVGQGNYWIDGDLGRFAVRGSLVSHVERLPKPGLGQQVTGLQAGDLVRAKVKTGYIEGRLISMKDDKALVETATGMRITIEGAEVEPMGKSKTRVIVD